MIENSQQNQNYLWDPLKIIRAEAVHISLSVAVVLVASVFHWCDLHPSQGSLPGWRQDIAPEQVRSPGAGGGVGRILGRMMRCDV